MSITITVDERTAAAIGYAMAYCVEDGDPLEHRVLVDLDLDQAARDFYPQAQKLVLLHDNVYDPANDEAFEKRSE